MKRMDRLDEKLTGEIKSLDNKFTSEIKALDNKFSSRFDNLRFWTISAVLAIIAGFAGTILTLALC